MDEIEEYNNTRTVQDTMFQKKIRIVHLLGEVSDLLSAEGFKVEKEIFDRLAIEIQNTLYFEMRKGMERQKNN